MRETPQILPVARLADEPPAARVLAEKVRRDFAEQHASSDPCIYFVPGRIEVLGKHTDYAGGRSLTCAIDRGICVGGAPLTERRLEVVDLTRGVTAVTDLENPGQPSVHSDWRRYVVAVAFRLRADYGAPLCGARVVLASNLPPAAGLSSSSALVVGLYLALASAGCFPSRRRDGYELESLEELAGYLGVLEAGESGESGEAGEPGDAGRSQGSSNTIEGVGTLGGSEDHTAILCSRPAALGCWSYDPIRLEKSVSFPPDRSFVVAVSGVHASKAGEARESYNRASGLARGAAQVWRKESGCRHRHLAAAIEARGAETVREAIAGGRHDEHGALDLLERFDHFAEESGTLVPEGVAAIGDGDLGLFGEIVERSQRLSEDKLRNQVPETAYLAASAREVGALAASAFGAGFGGSVWAMVHETDARAMTERWQEAYAARFPQRTAAAAFFTTYPASGARRLV